MALKVKNPKKNLADILIEKERLNESYDSSSAVSLKTLEQTAEGEETVVQAVEEAVKPEKTTEETENRPIESTNKITEEQIHPSVPSIAISKQQPVEAPMQAPQAVYKQDVTDTTSRPVYMQERKPWEEDEDYTPPRRKRGRPYQGYAENTHVQSIYVRNDLYEYIMINYVGHGRKHTSFNKFVNAAINNYLRQLEEN